MDTLTKEKRSWNMSRIRCKDTKPEKRVRSYLHKAGYRFRLHVKNLPGSPDIVLPKHKTVVFVHGCYWHRHQSCKEGSYFPKNPSQGIEFWEEKFRKNVGRDQLNSKKLVEMGWRVITVWECETSDLAFVATMLESLREK